MKGAIHLSFPDIALHNYGYRNVYGLGPLIDPANSKLPFESSPARQ